MTAKRKRDTTSKIKTSAGEETDGFATFVAQFYRTLRIEGIARGEAMVFTQTFISSVLVSRRQSTEVPTKEQLDQTITKLLKLVPMTPKG